MKDYIVVIPARYNSKRFKGKPLANILGKPMIQHVYENCLKAVPKELIFIATDDDRIKDVALGFGANTIMTSKNCLTGTDRVAEVAVKIKAKYYINVQGDEPIINHNDILEVIKNIGLNNGDIINGYCQIDNEEDYRSINIPKVVFRPDGRLMYMSRSEVPGNKNRDFKLAFRQVCIYAFPAISLEKFSEKKNKTLLEDIEDIEILRFLEMGFEVKMVKLSNSSISVDLKSDIQKVINKLT